MNKPQSLTYLWLQYTLGYGWRHISMVRMSVFGQQTFQPLPELWLTVDYSVGKLSAMGQPTRSTQPSIITLSASEMTYIVSGGALNSTRSLTPSITLGSVNV